MSLTFLSVSSILLIGGLELSVGLGTSRVSWESRYLNDLASSYNKDAPPITADTEQLLNVTLHVHIIGIDDVNEKTSSLTATFIIIQGWVDLRLQYNCSDYGGLENLFIPASQIWLPDIVPWNTDSLQTRKSLYGEKVLVQPSGHVYYIPIDRVTTKCDIDVSNFPNDVQTCTMWFGTWTLGANKMVFNLGSQNTRVKDVKQSLTSTLHPVYNHPEWALLNDIVNVKIETKDMVYGKLEIVLITCNLARRGSIYQSLSVAAGAMMALIIPFLFVLPSGTSEKTTLGMLTIVGFALLILMLQAAIPLNHNTVPRIGRFYVCSIVVTSLCVIVSIMLSHLRMRKTNRGPLPSWLKSVFLNPGEIRRYLLLEDYTAPDTPYITGISHVTKPEDAQVVDSKTDILLKEVCTYARYISGKLMAEETVSVVHSDWDELVRVADRILFIFFSLLYLTTALAFLT